MKPKLGDHAGVIINVDRKIKFPDFKKSYTLNVSYQFFTFMDCVAGMSGIINKHNFYLN